MKETVIRRVTELAITSCSLSPDAEKERRKRKERRKKSIERMRNRERRKKR